MFSFPTVGECVEPPVYPVNGLTDIRGMDVYSEGSTLHAVLVGKLNNADLIGVAYLRSGDYGATWTKPVLVNRKQDDKIVSRRGNEAQVSAAGNRIVVVYNHSVELPNVGPMTVAYSSDSGASWKQGDNPAAGDKTQVQSYADLVADKSGVFHLVWLDDREENGNTQGLRYARSLDGGRHWRGDVALDGSVCTCCWNRLLALPNLSVVALYRDDDPHDMSLSRVATDGKSWESLGTVGSFGWKFAGCPHCGGGIAKADGKSGLLHSVVWSGKENAAGLYYLNSVDLGRHWSTHTRLADAKSRESDIAVLNDGRIGVVFVSPSGNGEGLQFISSSDGGKSWSAPKRLNNAGSVADHPRILSTPKGFRVFWTENQSEGAGKIWAMSIINKQKEGKTGT